MGMMKMIKMVVMIMMLLFGTILGEVKYLPESYEICVKQCHDLCSDSPGDKNCIPHCIFFKCGPPPHPTNFHYPNMTSKGVRFVLDCRKASKRSKNKLRREWSVEPSSPPVEVPLVEVQSMCIMLLLLMW
ncbi:hypothetical protein EUTSA_v10015723mg [Eutrema salsugineum]|uniref:Uncharacterized protein n=1 Tax=Eutrema salsugineum TaxID=72664 RepID=V4LI08_EUTSA|nr:hypothetical protein EUTSA_v10015723mg [Eutrema salsugineum]